MSHDLTPEDAAVSATVYWGGTERGVCYQITGSNDDKTGTYYVQGTRAEMVQAALAILRDAAQDAPSHAENPKSGQDDESRKTEDEGGER